MKKLLLLGILLSSSALGAPNAPSGSPRVQGVPAGYGDPVQVTIRNTDGSAPAATAVTQSGTWNLTDISGTVSLPTGAATAANQTTSNSSLSTIATNTTGVATAANQSTANTTLSTINTSVGTVNTSVGTTNTDLGAPGATACATDTGSCSVNALQQRIAQRLTTINTTLGTPFQAGGALAANQSVNVAQINGVTPLMGNGVTGTGSLRVTLASDTTSNTNPLLFNQSQINGIALSTGNGVVGTGVQRVAIASDNTAFSVNAVESGTWNITNVSGTVSLPTGAATAAKQPALGTAGTSSADVISVQGVTSMTPVVTSAGQTSTYWYAVSTITNSTTPVTLHAACGASCRNYVTSLQILCGSLGASSEMFVTDGAGGSDMFRMPSPSAGTQLIAFQTPLRTGLNNATTLGMNVASITGSCYINAQGFTGV